MSFLNTDEYTICVFGYTNYLLTLNFVLSKYLELYMTFVIEKF